MLGRHAVLPLFALSICATLLGQQPTPPPTDSVLWKFAGNQDVTFMRLTPFGTVVVGTTD